MTTKPRIKSYEDANAACVNRGVMVNRRKIDNNTYLERRSDGSIAVRLHDTDVVTYYPDGLIELRTDGWDTSTTQDRIDRYSPIRMYKRKGELLVRSTPWSDPDGEESFFEGMQFVLERWHDEPKLTPLRNTQAA